MDGVTKEGGNVDNDEGKEGFLSLCQVLSALYYTSYLEKYSKI